MDNDKEKLERKDIDNYYKRNSGKYSYKNRHFDGKRTARDEYSGEILYYSSKGANNTGKARHYTTKKTAATDHIKPIDQINEKYGHLVKEGKITKEQLKELANSDYNLAITSQHRNSSKGNLSNHEYLYRQLKKGEAEDFNTSFTMLQEEVKTNIAGAYEAKAMEVENKIQDALNLNEKGKAKIDAYKKNSSNAVASGVSAAFMTLTVSTVNNIVMVATKDKDVKQAAKDIAAETGGSFGSAFALDLIQSAAAEHAKNTSNEMLKNILSNELPIQQISTAVMIGTSVVHYINGDISAEDCATEIILNGIGALAYSLGSTIGGPAGAIVATIVAGQISKAVIKYQQENKVDKEKQAMLVSITGEALVEMERQRAKLQTMIDERNKNFDLAVNEGFDKIFASLSNDDADGISDGLNIILTTVGGHAAFGSLEEFDEMFYDDESVFTLGGSLR